MGSSARDRLDIARRRVQVASLLCSDTDGIFASAFQMAMKGRTRKELRYGCSRQNVGGEAVQTSAGRLSWSSLVMPPSVVAAESCLFAANSHRHPSAVSLTGPPTEVRSLARSQPSLMMNYFHIRSMLSLRQLLGIYSIHSTVTELSTSTK